MELDRFQWLTKRSEAAIDPVRPIVDPHHHLWRHSNSTYLATELLADTGGSHNVTQTVFVECRSKWDRSVEPHMAPVGETRFVAGEAAEMAERDGAKIGAIVSHADMTLGAGVREVLEAHEAAGAGLFRGIRHSVAWDEDPAVHDAHTGSTEAMLSRPEFREGVATLGSMGYSFDAWLYHPQIKDLVALAQELPEVSIVLDHLGGPLGVGHYADKVGRANSAWRKAMTAASQCPNITLKVGGIGMENVYGMHWAGLEAPPSSVQVAAFWSDRVRFCIDLFGPSRCMLESNFPVDRQTLPYSVLWNAMQIMTDSYTDEEKDDLFAETAKRVYRLAGC